ncbi:hypothetical protein [Clostridium felsineum]|uniref:hypothetical protein n=1 Tax=Clostridium felsineum TaxID=36839 RepID=UPI00098C3198|nr:hypothetical protein [Clostridium felsineum]URZ16896.1 hypothetical protein CLFE_029430 [Clostridium felsineum DSM 794]
MGDEFKVGDLVTGLPSAYAIYRYTTPDMVVGEVIYVSQTGEIDIEVLNHTTSRHRIGDRFTGLNPKYFVKVSGKNTIGEGV